MHAPTFLPGVLRRRSALVAPAACLLAACTIAPPAHQDFRVYERERFAADAPHSRALDVPPPAACQAARRALLSQGYFLYVEEAARLHGRKFFRPAPGTSVELVINVACLPAPGVDSRSVVYAAAWQDDFVTRRNPVAASVGVPVMGNVSMPVASTDDALVKVGVETVQDPSYYQRFFDLLVSNVNANDRGRAP